MTLESLLNQFIWTNSYISVELVKACVVLDMFKTFTRSGKSVVQLLKNEVLYYYNTQLYFGIARSSDYYNYVAH